MKTIIDWANANSGFVSLIGVASVFILSPLAAWLITRLERTMHRSRTDEEIRRIESIRSEFHKNLRFIDSTTDYGPVLIRDVARDHLYFDGDEREFDKRGSPPSFKVQLVGLSVHGIRVYASFLEKIKMVEDHDTWCLADSDDPNAKTAHPIGTIPFSSIVSVNWHGDPAHTFPHVFCRFDGPKRWPYRNIEYCERHLMQEGWNLYQPLVGVEKVIRKKF